MKIKPYSRTRREILDILRNAECLVRTKKGCLEAAVYLKRYEEEVILYLETWQSREDLERHVRSSQYDRILTALDLARDPPEITFLECNGRGGIEVIETMRNQGMGGGTHKN